MKQFLIFVKKEWFHIWRDRRTLLILIGMPVVQIIIFGFALTNEVKNSRIAVFDQSGDEATTGIIRQIDASRYFDVTGYVHSYDEINKEFRKGVIKLAIVFPAQFRQDLLHVNRAPVQLIADASDPNVANTLVNYAGAIITDYQKALMGNSEMTYHIDTQVKMLYNPELKGAYNFVPGVMAMVLMLVCAMMTSIAIVKEKEMGTMEVILVSPLKPFGVVLAKAVPYLLLSLVNIATILLLSVFMLEVPVSGSLILLVAESILFTLTSLALGLLISSLTSSQQTAMFISMMGMFLPTVMFSGFMFPVENMPVALQVISNIVPAKWYYYIVKAVMIKGLGFGAIWKETIILAGMTLALLGASIAKFKIRLA